MINDSKAGSVTTLSDVVSFLLAMLPAIDFNDYPFL
jgi:hypothetical protein